MALNNYLLKIEDAVCFDHVTFMYQYAGAPSLHDVSFRARKGETIGIIGGTGSGKSTLVNLIPRFYDPQQGNVFINKTNVKKMTRGNLCSTIGIVQQRPTLFRGSIRDNLRWGNENAEDKDLWLALEKGGFYQTLYNIQFQSV